MIVHNTEKNETRGNAKGKATSTYGDKARKYVREIKKGKN
jgi:hypothetical protein